MKTNSTTYISAIFYLSITSLIITLVLSILIFVFNYSALNPSTIIPSCLSQTYLFPKLALLQFALRMHTITAIIAIISNILAVIFLAKIYCSSSSGENDSKQNKNINKKDIIIIFILISCSLLCLVSNSGGKLSLFLENERCKIITQTTKLIVLMAISITSFILYLIQLILIIVLDYSEGDNDLNEEIDNKNMLKQQQMMNKHLEQKAKQYLSKNVNNKQDMLQNLLMKDQIYQFGDKQNQTIIKSPHTIPTNIFKRQSKNNNRFPIQKSNDNYNQYPPQRSIVQMNLQSIQKDNNKIYKQYYQLQQIDQNLLHAQNNDNLSQKFEQKNFELNNDLYYARQDLDQDLSPLQLKQLMRLTKDQYLLSNNNNKNLILQKQYKNPQIKINIKFIKIKQYKKQLQQNINQLINQNNQQYNQHKQNNQNKKQNKQQIDKPISQQTSKLLKTILFQNSKFYKDVDPGQTQCPISKYFQNQDDFQNRQKQQKQKKYDYSKQKVIFTKKRNKLNKDKIQKKIQSQSFNQGQSLLLQRIFLFGQEYVNQQANQQKQQQRIKQKKKKLLDTIRSKYE